MRKKREKKLSGRGEERGGGPNGGFAVFIADLT